MQGLNEALASGKDVKLSGNISVENEPLTIGSDKTITLDLNGYTLTGNVTSGRAIKIEGDNVDLVIDATGSEVDFGNNTYGIVEIATGCSNVNVTINGGTFEGTTDCGGIVKLRTGSNNTVTLNNVTYTDNCSLAPVQGSGAKNPWVINTDG